MSYPHKLNVLIVEDDHDAIEAHKTSLGALAKAYPHEILLASSFEDAARIIAASQIVHVVILDLNLPVINRGQAEPGLEPGEQLVQALAERDSYPIPVILVVSGKLNLLQSIGGLTDVLREAFWYGRLVNKGTLDTEHEIEIGLQKALAYVDVGIHLRDSGGASFPPLSPREDDLLRRCVLADSTRTGVDVRWWSAEVGPTVSHPTPNRGPTKVLMGHFLIDGAGPSIPTFFKFEPASNALSTQRDSAILAQKLSHAKVFHSSQSKHRSLIVTQSVTDRGTPIPLSEYLLRAPASVVPNLSRVVEEIDTQLSQLGELKEEEELLIRQIFWPFLTGDLLERARDNGRENVSAAFAAFDELHASTATLWVARCHCGHGDLNATNVAVDADSSPGPHAYIFDSAGMRPGFKHEDLATLEVTTLLFNSAAMNGDFSLCEALYGEEFVPAAFVDSSQPLLNNAYALVRAIRSRVASNGDSRVYALLAFDVALRQLLGLAVQPSPNKIRVPFDAFRLATWIARWLRESFPELFANPGARRSASDRGISRSE